MDEAALAKALEGCFFWEKTTKYDPQPPKAAVEIREAQRKFVPKKLRDRKEYLAPKEWWMSRMPPDNFDDQIEHLQNGVAAAIGVPVHDLQRKSTKRSSAFAKSFLMWSMCRYFDVSLAQMAKYIDRHHSTIIHGRDQFENEKSVHAELIAKMDAYMNYKEPTCG